MNVRLGPHEVDFPWPKCGHLTAAGDRVVRITYRRITREPEAVVRLVKKLAGSRQPHVGHR